LQIAERFRSDGIIEAISGFNWEGISQAELLDVARIYYYFSIQFRENLQIARDLYPDDEKLRQLEEAECDTSNLSPWPGVAEIGEKIDHDEFMRRLLMLSPIDEKHREAMDAMGRAYLDAIRDIEDVARAQSIASYEDGGLERVFRAFLRAQHWETPALAAFRHFLVEHIRFDSNTDNGHGALSRHLKPDDGKIFPLWSEFQRALVASVPGLLTSGGPTKELA
jgi:hypothetical protein